MPYTTYYQNKEIFKIHISESSETSEIGTSKKQSKKTHVAIFKCSDEKLLTTYTVKQVWIGKYSENHGNQGNPILLHVYGLHYVYINHTIMTFIANAPIREYITSAKNNTMPYAIDEKNNTYLLELRVVLIGLTTPDYTNPYDYYYDHYLIVSNTKTPKHIFELSWDDKPPQRIIEFYIGDKQTDLHYTTNYSVFDELSKIGKLYIVLGNAPNDMVAIDKEDFVDINKKFGKMAKFKPMIYKIVSN